MKLTLKQFLAEGGAATAGFGTERATKADMEAALDFIVKHAGLDRKELVSNLLGSTGHTLAGKRKDSGNMDIAFEEGKHDRAELIEKMRKATGMDKVHQTGGGVFSFAVPGVGNKKIQVDFMFVPSAKWARFGFNSSYESKHKGVVRAFLLMNLMKQLYEPGRDLQLKDEAGKEIARVRRSFKPDTGLERLFKLAPMRKDGKGRAALKTVKPEELEAELKRIGHRGTFSRDPDPIRDPTKAAALMFGSGVRPEQLDTAEEIIQLIMKRKDHATVFKNTIEDLNKQGLPIPAEIKQFS